MGVVIKLNREQKLVLLKALKDGCVDYDELARVNLRPSDKYDHMSEGEYEDELKKTIRQTCLMEIEYPDLVEECCKARYQCGGGCYLSNYFHRIAPDMAMQDSIKKAMTVYKPHEKTD